MCGCMSLHKCNRWDKERVLSEEAIRELAEDEDEDVRGFVAWLSTTPLDVLVKLSMDESFSVRKEAARTLLRLAREEKEMAK